MMEQTPEQRALMERFMSNKGAPKKAKVSAYDPETGVVRADIAKKVIASATPATERQMRRSRVAGDVVLGLADVKMVGPNTTGPEDALLEKDAQ